MWCLYAEVDEDDLATQALRERMDGDLFGRRSAIH
jgi:hypothetical protein